MRLTCQPFAVALGLAHVCLLECALTLHAAEGPLTRVAEVSLRADGATALHTSDPLIGLPFGVGVERIEMVFGFGSMEGPSAGEFLDALSVSLQPVGTERTALLFTADAHGVSWAPPNEGGFEMAASALVRSEIVFSDTHEPAWPLAVAYELSFGIPREVYDCGTRLVVDLFDNRDARASIGFVRDVRLIARAPYFLLESSASPAGPFAAEMGVTREARQFRLRAGGVARFFRLRADSPVTLRILPADPDAWRFAYEFPAPEARLEGAPRPNGPYTAFPAAVLDPEARRFRVTPSAALQFFRVRANVRTVITAARRAGADLEVSFEYRPSVFAMQSSAQPCGPFADDSMARFNTASQTITVSRAAQVRFFRIALSPENGPVRLRSVVNEEGHWRIGYVGGNGDGEVEP
jgi:hypothetical protein